MKHILTPVLLAIITACGSEQPYIDPQFAADVAAFKADCVKYGASCDFSKLNLEGAAHIDTHGTQGFYVGVCYREINTVKIRRDVTPSAQRVVVYHELGHCVLDRRHSDNRHGIMHGAGIDYDRAGSEEWDDMVKELFTGE